MVVVESMAAGTPVVGTRDGALPELINQPGIGRLFEPNSNGGVEPNNIAGLVQAIEECLDLSRLPQTAQHCRAEAERYSWPAVGSQFEELLERLASHRAFAKRQRPTQCKMEFQRQCVLPEIHLPIQVILRIFS